MGTLVEHEPVMTDTNDEGATPPNRGRTDHESMRRASELALDAPGVAASDTLAASGGLDLPGRMPQMPTPADQEMVAEPIPGERDPGTSMPSTPGIIGGTGYGENIPEGSGVPVDEDTRRESEREGGGDPGQRGKG
jgi:hypothetical protein